MLTGASSTPQAAAAGFGVGGRPSGTCRKLLEVSRGTLKPVPRQVWAICVSTGLVRPDVAAAAETHVGKS
eukprot:733482-Alexandrium_andersonii.AAC.1